MEEYDRHGNIWITSCVRMKSHSRFQRYDTLSHLTLTFYSIALLGLSIFEPQLSSTWIGPYTSSISILLSASLLSASLIVWGLGFGTTAKLHRECYLELRKLYDSNIDDEAKARSYHAILDKYPNQSDRDNEAFLFMKLWRDRGVVTNKNGKVTMGWFRAIIFLATGFARFIISSSIILFPLILTLIIYAIEKQ